MSYSLKSSNLDVWKESTRMTALKLFTRGLTIAYIAVLTRAYPTSGVGQYFFLTASTYLLMKPITGVATAVKKRQSERNTGHFRLYLIGWLGVIGTFIGLVLATVGLNIAVFPIQINSLQIGTQEAIAIALGVVGKGGGKLAVKQFEGIGTPWMGEVVNTLFFSGGRLAIIYWAVTYTSIDITTLFWLGELGGVVILFLVPLQMYRIRTIGSNIFPDREEIRSVYDFAKWSVPNELLGDFYHRMDTFYLAFFISTTVVGFYESSLRLAVIFALSSSISRVVAAKVSGIHAEGGDYFTFFNRILKQLVIITVAFLVVMIIVGKPLLATVYGPNYTEAYWFLIGLTAQQVLMAPYMLYKSFLNGTDQPSRITRVVGTTVVLNVLIAPPLILWLGGIGMVVATLITETIRALWLHHRVYVFEDCTSPITRVIASVRTSIMSSR